MLNETRDRPLASTSISAPGEYSAPGDPALLVTDRLMRPGMAQLVPRRLVRYEAAGDFKRTIDFYIGGDAEEEELPGGADERT